MELPEPAVYMPFLSGTYDLKPGLFRLGYDFGNAEQDHKIFQIDDTYFEYRDAKLKARAENLAKYFSTCNLSLDTERSVASYIARCLSEEYPEYFNFENRTFHNAMTGEEILLSEKFDLVHTRSPVKPYYVSSLDALASQIQEDISIVNKKRRKDWISAMHVCYPNHFSPGEKVGKSFFEAHMIIPGIEKINKNSGKIIDAIINHGPFVRFAWGISTDTRLNHHPDRPEGKSHEEWQGRMFDSKNPEAYVRVERQATIGFPDVDAVLFTVRPYFLDCKNLEEEQRFKLAEAIESMSETSLQYKGLKDSKDKVVKWIRGL